jgi:hypothetical protein
MPWVGFEPTILASAGAKTVHALDRAANVTGDMLSYGLKYPGISWGGVVLLHYFPVCA